MPAPSNVYCAWWIDRFGGGEYSDTGKSPDEAIANLRIQFFDRDSKDTPANCDMTVTKYTVVE